MKLALHWLEIVYTISVIVLIYKWKPISIKLENLLNRIKPLIRWILLPIIVGVVYYINISMTGLWMDIISIYWTGSDVDANLIFYFSVVLYISFCNIAISTSLAPLYKARICNSAAILDLCFWLFYLIRTVPAELDVLVDIIIVLLNIVKAYGLSRWVRQSIIKEKQTG